MACYCHWNFDYHSNSFVRRPNFSKRIVVLLWVGALADCCQFNSCCVPVYGCFTAHMFIPCSFGWQFIDSYGLFRCCFGRICITITVASPVSLVHSLSYRIQLCACDLELWFRFSYDNLFCCLVLWVSVGLSIYYAIVFRPPINSAMVNLLQLCCHRIMRKLVRLHLFLWLTRGLACSRHCFCVCL